MGNNLVSIKSSLAAGELSPSLYGRVDLEKWQAGTSTCRNFFVNYRGGVVSRAGLAYVGTCLQSGSLPPPRDIPFQFSLNQGYVLEFGEEYLRIKTDGAYITETPEQLTNISNGAPAVFTVPNHNFLVGDWVYISGVVGMTEFNGLTWIVHNVIDANTFTVTDLFGAVVPSLGFPAYVSGGSAARIYTVVTPYASTDLPYLKYTQSADVMTLTCVNTETQTEYPPYSLNRLGQADWTLVQNTFGSLIPAPTGLIVTAQSSAVPTTWYAYVVTAIDSKTGEESVASDIGKIYNNDISVNLGTNTISWTAVDGADSYNIYASPASYSIETPVSSEFGFIGTALGPSFVDNNSTPDFTVVPPVHNDPFARGAILQVIPTTGGINYSQNTISYLVTDPTGTGFNGIPVVADGSLIGFVITDPGEGYTAPVITFSDSGGGVATGSFTASANVSDGDSITINSVTITWKAPNDSLAGHQIELGNTAALSLQSLSIYLNSLSGDVNINKAVYTYDDTHLYITYKTSGTDGNLFRLGASPPPGWTKSGDTLTGGGTVGSGAVATITLGPATGTYPGVCTYFQQRRVYASSLNKPDTYFMSQPGLFTNFDTSIPVTGGDSIEGTPWALQVNGIQFMVPMPGGLVVLTGKGAWQVNGGSAAAITPSNETAVPQAYNGCHNNVPPINNNYHILYVQAKGSIVRDLAYNFFTNIYTGTDITVLSNHLFADHQIVQWAWAEEPYKLVWAVRDDGTLLCLTYLIEQEVYAWTRHDTNGLFQSVCTVTEPPVDAVYLIVKRFVKGGWRYYSERMDNRLWNDVEEVFCVDAGLSSSILNPQATLSPAAITGTNILFTTDQPVFNSSMVGDIIRVDGGQAQITGYNTPTGVHCNIIQDLTITVPNDPNLLPLPSVAGDWSITTPVTTVLGLNHLEGLTVAILADGSVVPNQVVHNGSIVLPQEASLITVGLPYTCQLQTLYIDHPSQNTVQTRRKNISAVGLIVDQTRGIQLGADEPDAATEPNNQTIPWTNLIEVKDNLQRNRFILAGKPIPLYTGPLYQTISASWSVEGQVAVQQSYPLPATILAIVAYWMEGDDR